MSAFCVYAAATWIARARAENKTPNSYLLLGVRHVLTLQEWKARVDEETQRIFERMKPVCASPLFDTPQFCLDWIRVAEKSGQIRDAQVMGWQVEEYPDGTIARDDKGRPKKAWLPYQIFNRDERVPNSQEMAAHEAA